MYLVSRWDIGYRIEDVWPLDRILVFQFSSKLYQRPSPSTPRPLWDMVEVVLTMPITISSFMIIPAAMITRFFIIFSCGLVWRVLARLLLLPLGRIRVVVLPLFFIGTIFMLLVRRSYELVTIRFQSGVRFGICLRHTYFSNLRENPSRGFGSPPATRSSWRGGFWAFAFCSSCLQRPRTASRYCRAPLGVNRSARSATDLSYQW